MPWCMHAACCHASTSSSQCFAAAKRSLVSSVTLPGGLLTCMQQHGANGGTASQERRRAWATGTAGKVGGTEKGQDWSGRLVWVGDWQAPVRWAPRRQQNGGSQWSVRACGARGAGMVKGGAI